LDFENAELAGELARETRAAGRCGMVATPVCYSISKKIMSTPLRSLDTTFTRLYRYAHLAALAGWDETAMNAA
jgi:hypothetical protein